MMNKNGGKTKFFMGLGHRLLPILPMTLCNKTQGRQELSFSSHELGEHQGDCSKFEFPDVRVLTVLCIMRQ